MESWAGSELKLLFWRCFSHRTAETGVTGWRANWRRLHCNKIQTYHIPAQDPGRPHTCLSRSDFVTAWLRHCESLDSATDCTVQKDNYYYLKRAAIPIVFRLNVVYHRTLLRLYLIILQLRHSWLYFLLQIKNTFAWFG